MTDKKCCDRPPQAGETFRCESCGMSLTTIVKCSCDPADLECLPSFMCCGAPLCCVTPVNPI